MFAPTSSPTVREDAFTVYSAFSTTPTDSLWALLSELLLSFSIGAQRSASVEIPRFSQLATSLTGDSGAILLGPRANNPYRDLDPRYERLMALLSESARSHATLSPAQIVDSTVGEIRAPHLEALDWIRQATGFSRERIAGLLGVSRQTLNRWERSEPIKDVNRRRIFATREVLERASARLKTRAALVEWLDTPRGADGRTPAECLAAGDINRARLLAISSPSPGVSRPPSWVRRPVPEAFRKGAEHLQEAVPPEPDIEGTDD